MQNIFQLIVKLIKHRKKEENASMKLVQHYQMLQHTSMTVRMKKPRTVLFVIAVVFSILLALHGIIAEFSG